ncbi:hypothetical protein ACNJYD_10245 [Bradyrhizobium sp. DASA03005]|uniref:hypothetical protein n=1 Tax=Bradyrhizobium sp. SPXBL-02 TaxID=3395912 RepID=UPI003F6EA3A8
MEGLVVNELARAGLFPLRATLVGSMAYQTYSGVVVSAPCVGDLVSSPPERPCENTVD